MIKKDGKKILSFFVLSAYRFINKTLSFAIGGVAPFAGAWIEMMKNNFEFGLFMVAPFVGVRIEISGTEVTEMSCSVAPFMGA